MVTANQVVHQLLVNDRGEMPTRPKCPKLSPISEDDSSLVFPFTEEKYRKSMTTLKNKAAGIDDVMVEQLKNLGPRAPRWLHSMLNVCFTEKRHTQGRCALLRHTRVGTHFYDIPGSGRSLTTYPGHSCPVPSSICQIPDYVFTHETGS